MKFYIASSENDLKRCFTVIQELRPHLDVETFLKYCAEANNQDQYQILVAEDDGKIMAAMGYRFLTDLVRGRHVYIDDLVTTAEARSQGLGSLLLKKAEEIAVNGNCKSLRLCTGLDNAGGIQFYEREGWSKRAYAYTKKIN